MSNIKNSAYIYEISITSKNGDVIDLKNVFTMFNIYENMLSHFLYADLTIKDTNDIIKNLPIIGGESVAIRFRDDDNISALFFDFIVISEPQQIKIATGKDKNELVHLKLASIYNINNNIQRISGKFKDEKSSVIQNIIDTYLRSYKTLNTDSSISGEIEFVANNWKPSDIIDYVCSQSKDAIFFEHNRQFFTFDTISNLLKQEITNELYLATKFEHSVGSNHVLAYQFEKKFNIENSYKSGMFGQTVYKPSIYEYSFEKKSKSLDEISGSEFPLLGSNKLFQEVLSTVDNSISLTYQDIDSKLYRNMIIQTLQNYNLHVKTRGSSERKAGDIIKFNMPSVDNMQVNESFSGKWMIVQIKHSVTADLEYTQNIKLWKNAFTSNKRV